MVGVFLLLVDYEFTFRGLGGALTRNRRSRQPGPTGSRVEINSFTMMFGGAVLLTSSHRICMRELS